MRSLLTSLLLGAFVLGTSCSGPVPDTGEERTNVVLVIIDTLRADKLSSYGHPADPSPALTRLAAGGVQFESVTAQTSWTLPSVGSMLTSHYPRTLGLYVEGGGRVPDRYDTLAEVLRENGYRTFGITANPNLNSRSNFDQGFDEYIDSQVVFRESRDDVPEGKVLYGDATLHRAPDVFGKALEFVHESGNDGPYFLQIDVMEVHEHADRAMLRDEYAVGFKGHGDAAYLRRVRQVTDDLERFVERLRGLDGWGDTLFVVTSDHGEGLFDHPDVEPSRGHGSLLYDSHVRVPWLMFNDAWTPARSRVTQRVRLLELMPTVLDYLDIPAPAGIQGVSLMPLVDGEAERADIPELIVTETYFRGRRKISALGDEWQYVHNRVPNDDLPEHELQRRDRRPNGLVTDRSDDETERVRRFRSFVAEWEDRHEAAEPSLHEAELSDAEREQLEKIGYAE